MVHKHISAQKPELQYALYSTMSCEEIKILTYLYVTLYNKVVFVNIVNASIYLY